ncbi:MAG: hypothetical protein ABSG65_21190 [Bryobacteraceae bacterium]
MTSSEWAARRFRRSLDRPNQAGVGAVDQQTAIRIPYGLARLRRPIGSRYDWAFEILDAFAGESGREAHSNSPIAQALLPTGASYTTIETKGSFSRPIALETGRVRAEARVVYRGRRIV